MSAAGEGDDGPGRPDLTEAFFPEPACEAHGCPNGEQRHALTRMCGRQPWEDESGFFEDEGHADTAVMSAIEHDKPGRWRRVWRRAWRAVVGWFLGDRDGDNDRWPPGDEPGSGEPDRVDELAAAFPLEAAPRPSSVHLSMVPPRPRARPGPGFWLPAPGGVG